MALLFFDGFDHYNTALMGAMWTTAGGTTNAGTGRNASQSLRDPVQPFMYLPQVSGNTCIVGAWMKFRTAFIANNILYEISAGGALDAQRQVWMRTNADGTISVMTGAGALGVSTLALSLATEYYIEFKVLIDDTVGTAEVHVTDVAAGTVATYLSLTGKDTQNTATTGWNAFRMSSTGNVDVDDLYICDGSGTIHNDFLGDCRVEALYAKTDATAPGSNAGQTPSTGTDHGALVDEHPPNDDTDYNSSATTSVKDTYRVDAMVSSGLIIGVQTCLYARKTDAVSKTATPVVRSAAFDYDGATQAVNSTYEYMRQIDESDPATAIHWLSTSVNLAQIGLKIAN